MTAGDPCRDCGHSTALGSGRFVNRLPADDGYLCAECAAIECDACGELIPLDEDITAEMYDPIGAVYCYKFHAECVPAGVVVLDGGTE